MRRVLAAYVAHYNRARPHRGLGQQTPIPYDRMVAGTFRDLWTL